MPSRAASTRSATAPVDRHRHRDLRARARKVVELEEIACVALGEVVEEDEDLVEAGVQRQVEFALFLEIAAVGRHPAGFGAIHPEHRAAAGAESHA